MIQRYGTHRNGAKYRQGIRLAFLRALKIRQAYRAARPTLIGEIDRAGIDARLIHGLERLASRGIPATARVGGQHDADLRMCRACAGTTPATRAANRSEEHTSELQSLMRISYAVLCLK